MWPSDKVKKNSETNQKVHCVMQLQLSLSFKVFSPEYQVIANYFVSTLNYVASYLCTLSIVGYGTNHPQLKWSMRVTRM